MHTSINTKLESNFNSILALLDILNKDFKAYLVGGILRDLLLNQEIKDIDIAINTHYLNYIHLLKNYKITNINKQYSIIDISLDGLFINIASFRAELSPIFKDGKPLGRTPKAIFFIDSIRLDSKRRDFTINALYWSKKEGLLDFNNSLLHLKNKTLTCINHANTKIKNDPLRALRALNFAARFNFKLDSKLYLAIKNNLSLIKNISSDVKIKFLEQILKARYADKILPIYKDILKEIFCLDDFLSINNLSFKYKNGIFYKNALALNQSLISSLPKNIKKNIILIKKLGDKTALKDIYKQDIYKKEDIKNILFNALNLTNFKEGFKLAKYFLLAINKNQKSCFIAIKNLRAISKKSSFLLEEDIKSLKKYGIKQSQYKVYRLNLFSFYMVKGIKKKRFVKFIAIKNLKAENI